MQRVMIVGGPGSGKSMLAAALGARTGVPVYHMDKIHWLPGWVERTREDKDRLTREIHARDQWIFEGGHSRTYAERFARADTYIWLDVPVSLRVWRVLRRSWRFHGQTRPDLPDGCPEQFNLQTLEFLKFIWDTRHSARDKMAQLYRDAPAGKAVYRLTSLKEVHAFLEALPEGRAGVGGTA